MGLPPPYLEEGVPGRGLPLRSTGSYAGRRDEFEDVRDGEYEERLGDIRLGDTRFGEYGIYGGASVGGGRFGALARIDGDRERAGDACGG